MVRNVIFPRRECKKGVRRAWEGCILAFRIPGRPGGEEIVSSSYAFIMRNIEVYHRLGESLKVCRGRGWGDTPRPPPWLPIPLAARSNTPSSCHLTPLTTRDKTSITYSKHSRNIALCLGMCYAVLGCVLRAWGGCVWAFRSPGRPGGEGLLLCCGALVVTAACTLRINPILDDFAGDLPGKPCVMNTKGHIFREVSAAWFVFTGDGRKCGAKLWVVASCWERPPRPVGNSGPYMAL